MKRYKVEFYRGNDEVYVIVETEEDRDFALDLINTSEDTELVGVEELE